MRPVLGVSLTALCFAQVTAVLAADLGTAGSGAQPILPRELTPADPAGVKVFGQISAGAKVFFGREDDVSDEDFVVPAVFLRGQVAIRPQSHRFGLQFDGEVSGFDVRWVDPTPPTDGHFLRLTGRAHLTYTVNDQIKLGVFGSLRRHSVYLNDSDDSLDLAAYTGTYGVEAIYLPHPNLTLHGRAGFVDPFRGSVDADFGGSVMSDSFSDSDNDVFGHHVGGGFRFMPNPNWSLAGDMAYSSLDFGSDVNLKVYHVEASVGHSMKNHPLEVVGSFGLLHNVVSATGFGSGSLDVYTGKIRLIHRFGDNPGNADGTLFTNYPL